MSLNHYFGEIFDLEDCRGKCYICWNKFNKDQSFEDLDITNNSLDVAHLIHEIEKIEKDLFIQLKITCNLFM